MSPWHAPKTHTQGQSSRRHYHSTHSRSQSGGCQGIHDQGLTCYWHVGPGLTWAPWRIPPPETHTHTHTYAGIFFHLHNLKWEKATAGNNGLAVQRPNLLASHLNCPGVALDGVCLSPCLFAFPKEAISSQGLKCPQEEFGDKCLNNTGSCHENDFLHMRSTSLFIKMWAIMAKLVALPKEPALDIMQINLLCNTLVFQLLRPIAWSHRCLRQNRTNQNWKDALKIY